jgi:hydrogenase maturation protease
MGDNQSPRSLILGVGNTLLSDDAVGIIVARELHARLSQVPSAGVVDFAETSYAGWRLIDLLAGYTKAIIIDSLVSGKGAPGECFKVDRNNINSLHLSSSHGLGLNESISLAVGAGMVMPDDIVIYAVEVKNPFDFGETVSPEVVARIPGIVEQILVEEQARNGRDSSLTTG